MGSRVAAGDHGRAAGVTAPARRGLAVLRETGGVVVVGLGVMGLALLLAEGGGLPEDDLIDILVLGAVGLGAAAGLLGDVAGRLSGDVRPSWLGAALVLYTFVVIPSGTLWPEIVEGDGRIGVATRLAAFVVILGLLVVAVRPPQRVGHWLPWAVAGVGVLLAVVAGRVTAAEPATTLLVQPAALSVAVLLAWLVVDAWVLVGGLRRRDHTVTWMALGLLVIAGAHVERVLVGADFDHPEVVFAAVRLVGVLAVLVGTLQLVGGGVAAVRTEHEELTEELRIAAQHVQRAGAAAAERDHELRNGLTGLSGITRLLSAGHGDGEQEQLKAAVLHELARLAAMVEGHSATGDAAEAGTFDVSSVLVESVVLRRAAGERISLSCPPVLRARGRPDMFAQVLTNLLTNCAQHAPGSPARVSAGAVGSRVVVEVTDDGPGVASGLERLVIHRGVRARDSEGLGLGLDVSRELLASAGGSLRVLPRSGRRGFTVVVELVRAGAEATEEPTAQKIVSPVPVLAHRSGSTPGRRG